MGNSCGPDRVMFADGSNSWCVYWDRTGNGVDETDEIVPLFDESSDGAIFQCQPFNGEIPCGYPGNFYSDPILTFPNGPNSPDQPVYFLRVGGANYCWTSDTFRIAEGYQVVYLTEGDWACEQSPCGDATAPAPVTNLDVSVDEECLHVDYSFEHDGANVTSFNVWVRTDPASEWIYATNLEATVRSAGVDVCADGVVQIGVEADNAGMISDMAVASGSTYLRHFSEAGNGAIEFLGGRDIRINLASPPAGDRCEALVWFDLYSGGSFLERILTVDNPEHQLELSFECQLPNSVPNPQCYIVMIDSSTHNGGLITACGLTDTTDMFLVAADDAPGIAREFALAQNYPNPFNPSTTIEFSLPTDASAELAVYNLAGQEVARLLSGNMTAGSHRVTWNGVGQASGMYFYRLQAGTNVLTRKMLLMK
ncbi:MAG: T9SS type A sorting domain-containing protein [bacterium]|nr:T9SS type A sorting domain-containing protein [bacterium]